VALELNPDLLAAVAGFTILAFTVVYALRHIKEMPGLAAYVELIRPFTLLFPLIAGTAFGVMGAHSTGWANWDLSTLIMGVGALVLVNAGSNTLNSVYDVDIDRINKPYRPIPRGAVNPQEALTLAWLLYIFTVWRATATNQAFAAFLVAIMFLTIAYSAPPFRLKKRFIVNNVSIALARGLFGVLAAWSIFGDPLHPVPWTVGAVFFVFLVGAATTKDFTDIKGDAAYDIKTLPVVLGVSQAARVSAAFFIIPLAIIPISVQFDLLYPNANFLVLLGFLGANAFRHTHDWASSRDPVLENGPMWRQMYILMMALALGFSATYLLP
jgi:4-hydroxybenzoate polyprenyltransferase